MKNMNATPAAASSETPAQMKILLSSPVCGTELLSS